MTNYQRNLKPIFTSTPSCFVRDWPALFHFVTSTFAHKHPPSMFLSIHPHIHHHSRRLPTQPPLSLRILTVSKKKKNLSNFWAEVTTLSLTVLLYQVQFFWTKWIGILYWQTNYKLKNDFFTFTGMTSSAKHSWWCFLWLLWFSKTYHPKYCRGHGRLTGRSWSE